ncbi:SCF E3 ubiquitin ligase complex F-box protein GrrA [Mycena indigotica]|uniref:SCF E3 ubiquitin ligase complex F-box protein GrrA n=1 Tax=Mycena indigotica TaxID=2126181 RepID=A0A8H6SM33_9AGAR|nr:SCF E3 ubiquitin ligase complex F-box protein GrrA [Mycena indigotica]KAF7301834.1 SCF E3 ubiquitin ligase complex F-box protein GrrA [Mycena indigotica]
MDPHSRSQSTKHSITHRLNLQSLTEELRDPTFSERLQRLKLVDSEQVLPALTSLVSIDLTGVVNTDNTTIVQLASSMPHLQKINITNCKSVSDEGILALAGNCPLLRRVTLSGLEELTDHAVSALATSCPLLCEVDLSHCKLITDVSIRDIWVHLNHLQELRLSSCEQLTDAAFPAAVQVGASAMPLVIGKTFEDLRVLDLRECLGITDAAIEGIIAHAPHIRHLILHKCSQLTDRSVDAICKLGDFLHHLELGHLGNITDGAVRALVHACTRLRYVDFASCTLLTDISVFELAALPKLRRVGLVRCLNLTDKAIFGLAEGLHGTLERLHLSYCDQISVEAIHALLQKADKLDHLSLTGVTSFSQRPELRQFCRQPPEDFTIAQRKAFYVYSGKGISELRRHLAKTFEHSNAERVPEETVHLYSRL